MYMYAHEMYEDTKKQPEGVIRMTVEIIAERKEDNGRQKKTPRKQNTEEERFSNRNPIKLSLCPSILSETITTRENNICFLLNIL